MYTKGDKKVAQKRKKKRNVTFAVGDDVVSISLLFYSDRYTIQIHNERQRMQYTNLLSVIQMGGGGGGGVRACFFLAEYDRKPIRVVHDPCVASGQTKKTATER